MGFESEQGDLSTKYGLKKRDSLHVFIVIGLVRSRHN